MTEGTTRNLDDPCINKTKEGDFVIRCSISVSNEGVEERRKLDFRERVTLGFKVGDYEG